MADVRKISKQDLYLKARMHAEGVRIVKDGVLYEPPEVDLAEVAPAVMADTTPEEFLKERMGQMKQAQTDNALGNAFIVDALGNSVILDALGNAVILDGAGIPAPIFPTPDSKLTLTIDEDRAIVSEDGVELTRGRFYTPHRPWDDETLSNGLPIQAALPGMSSSIVNVLISLSCNNYNTGKGCKYCGLFSNRVSRGINQMPLEFLQYWGKLQAEALKIVTDYGWRGNVAVSGGALPPSQRPRYMDRLKAILVPIREALDDKSFSRLNVVYNHYPPENFEDMYEWKELGVTGTSIDMEVCTAESFERICPGKHAYKPWEYWKEAQEASVEVFGPILHTTTDVVAGIDPMDDLVEAIDERMSKGVLVVPLTFIPDPSSAMADGKAPDAQWQMEAAERIADVYFKHGPKFGMAVLRAVGPSLYRRHAPAFLGGKKGGYKKSGPVGGGSIQTTHLTIVFDEVIRRFQKIPGAAKRMKLGVV